MFSVIFQLNYKGLIFVFVELKYNWRSKRGKLSYTGISRFIRMLKTIINTFSIPKIQCSKDSSDSNIMRRVDDPLRRFSKVMDWSIHMTDSYTEQVRSWSSKLFLSTVKFNEVAQSLEILESSFSLRGLYKYLRNLDSSILHAFKIIIIGVKFCQVNFPF